MTTAVFVTGWEHGVNPTVNGGGLAAVVTGTPAAQAVTKRTGGYALQCDTTSAECHITWIMATPTAIVARIYVRFGTLPDEDSCTLILTEVTAGVRLALNFDTGANRFYARFVGAADGNAAAVTIDVDTWYRIDLKFSVVANPSAIDFAIDGTAAAQSTYAQAATTFTSFGIGMHDSASTNVYWDDMIISNTAADYPVGAGQVDALLPSADGAHNNAADTIEDDAGNDIDGATHTAFSHINQVPMSESTLYLKQSTVGTDHYVEVAFADVGNYTAYHGVGAILAYGSSGTNANEGACIIIDEDTTATTVWGSPASRADYSETPVFYKFAILPNPAGGLDKAAIDALIARLGYSNDIADVPYWENLMLEVAHNATAPAAGGVPKHAMYYQRMRKA